MRTLRLASFLLLAACGSRPAPATTPANTTPVVVAPPAPGTSPEGPEPLPALPGCDKLDYSLKQKLAEYDGKYNVEITLSSIPTKAEQQELGIEYVPPGNMALGMLDRAQLARLCADPRVTRLQASPEMMPS
jgi:hypothetical protein